MHGQPAHLHLANAPDTSRPVDPLADVLELGARLDLLELTVGQVCKVAGISKMQLDYWTIKARIQTKGNKQRLYDLQALRMVLLIKQAVEGGLTLAAAVDAHAVRLQD
jgi:MerR-like DNA binding protein